MIEKYCSMLIFLMTNAEGSSNSHAMINKQYNLKLHFQNNKLYSTTFFKCFINFGTNPSNKNKEKTRRNFILRCDLTRDYVNMSLFWLLTLSQVE